MLLRSGRRGALNFEGCRWTETEHLILAGDNVANTHLIGILRRVLKYVLTCDTQAWKCFKTVETLIIPALYGYKPSTNITRGEGRVLKYLTVTYAGICAEAKLTHSKL